MRRWLVLGVSLILNSILITSLLSSGSAAALVKSRQVCTTDIAKGYARCHAIVLTDSSGVAPLSSSTPQGYGPATFKAAYGASGTAHGRIAIVGAYDAPNILNDVNVYSKTFGLPSLPACTSASQTGCFEKLSQIGSNSLPATNSSWAVETSLDVETAHSMCTNCRISLYEATSSSLNNLSTAVATAATRGANVISNSYGGPESASEYGYDGRYKHAGVTVLASSGDSGYGTNYPAASPNVIAVGGTTLQMNNNRLVSETAWSGAGSGCSQYEPKPSWQHDHSCSRRTVADISADADPNTGAAIYDSTPTSGHSGWLTVGGTSLASPLVAGILASTGSSIQPTDLYASSHIRDVVGGTNGSCSTYLCKAVSGYDGPTGLGVLNKYQ